MALSLLNKHKSFDGTVEFYSHRSKVCQSEMRFSIYRPPQAASRKVPVLYWLSGLTCNEEIFMFKSGVQRFASQRGLLIVAPDTSPRKTGIAGEDQDWEVGTGAGFYVNATTMKWSKHFQMYDYVTKELPELVQAELPALPNREGIFGHSMGGHGALVAALRQPGRYQSVSAFAPICAPSQVAWGKKGFTALLGTDTQLWKQYDSTALISNGKFRQPILVDQGLEDKFLKEQLRPELLQEACERAGTPLTLRMQPGYDHSYYFISTFIRDHIEYHAQFLNTM